jgi:Uma2 family endonuclease
MSAASAGIRQLRESDISQMFNEEGACSLKAVDLPAVFHSDRLRDNDAFAQFCSEHGPLRIERYPEGEILVMAPAHSRTGHLELLLGMELGIWTRANATGMAFGPSAGFDLRDECVLEPDASLDCAGSLECADDRRAIWLRTHLS